MTNSLVNRAANRSGLKEKDKSGHKGMANSQSYSSYKNNNNYYNSPFRHGGDF